MGLDEYIQRRRKEREDRKELIASIKLEMEIELKNNLEKHKLHEFTPEIPHEVDEMKLKEREEFGTKLFSELFFPCPLFFSPCSLFFSPDSKNPLRCGCARNGKIHR
jgi:hypothetical protein